MSYRKAEDIFPMEVIEIIQKYVDGETIYIPRILENKKEWGSRTQTKIELEERNFKIFKDYLKGEKILELSEKYFLSDKSIQRIVYKLKNG